MPNHVTHKFTVKGTTSELQKFYLQCFTTAKDCTEFDFNSLIPQPEILLNTISGNTQEMATPEYKALEAEAIEQTGCKNWYDWCCTYWGTKWNAYSCYVTQEEEELFFEFDTAWSCPEPIFNKLAEQFPTLEFRGYALDEGYGFGAEITIEDGEASVEYLDARILSFISEFI